MLAIFHLEHAPLPVEVDHRVLNFENVPSMEHAVHNHMHDSFQKQKFALHFPHKTVSEKRVLSKENIFEILFAKHEHLEFRNGHDREESARVLIHFDVSEEVALLIETDRNAVIFLPSHQDAPRLDKKNVFGGQVLMVNDFVFS